VDKETWRDVDEKSSQLVNVASVTVVLLVRSKEFELVDPSLAYQGIEPHQMGKEATDRVLGMIGRLGVLVMLNVTVTPDVELAVTEEELDRPVNSETLVDRDTAVPGVDVLLPEECELGYDV
jgi:hypothetical protein